MDEKKKKKRTNYVAVAILSAVSAALLTVIVLTSARPTQYRDELLGRTEGKKKFEFYFVDPGYVIFADQINKLASGLDVAYDPYTLNRLNFPDTYDTITKAVFPVRLAEARERTLLWQDGRITRIQDRAQSIVVPNKNPEYLSEKEKEISQCVKLMDQVQKNA